MKIGIVATSIWRSVHLEMAKALVRRGHQVAVYTEDATIPTITRFTRRVEDGVEIFGIHHERRNPWVWLPDRLFKPLLGRRFFTTFLAIYRFLRASRCDVYMVEGDWLGVFLGLARYLTPFRWIVSVHDHEYMGVLLGYPGEPSNRLREMIKRWVLRRADGIRTNSMVTRDILVRGGISAATITVIPLHYTQRMLIGAEIGAFRAAARRDIFERHDMAADCELMVAACRLTPFKGLELAVKAFAGVLRARPKARFVVCGGDREVKGIGSYRGLLERLASECSVGHELVFAGDVPPGEIKRYYAASDLHLVPSYIDTFNYSAVEAALAGTRTVMTDLVGCGHWLKAADAAYVVEGRDADAFAAAILLGLEHRYDAAGVAQRTADALGVSRLAGEVEAMLARQAAPLLASLPAKK